MRKKSVFFLAFVFMLCFVCPDGELSAKEYGDASLLDGMMDELNMGQLEDYLEDNEQTKDISFIEMVKNLTAGGEEWNLQALTDYVTGLLFEEIRENKRLLFLIAALAASFALLRNFSGIFRNSYISNLCFVMVYVELMMLLMKSFLVVGELLGTTLDKVVEFMKMLLPVFCMTMVFSNGTNSAAAFYEMAFLVIYLVQYVMLYFLAPLVQVFVAMQFLNYVLEGEKFTRMCELLEDIMRWAVKIMVTLVMGLNVVQGLIYPAVDRLKTTSWSKTVSMIPGIGNSANAIGEMLIGTGMVIKNSVGVAAMLLLVVLFAVPLIKIGVLTFLYKLIAAVLEPITDKRIAGSINGVYKGSVLAGKLMLTSLFLFFVTIAMITASTSFVAG